MAKKRSKAAVEETLPTGAAEVHGEDQGEFNK